MSDRVDPRSNPKGLDVHNLFGRDDARDAFYVDIEKLAKGDIGIMGFRHAHFMFQACNVLYEHTRDNRFELWAQMFAIQDIASIYRNIRLMIALNEFRVKHGRPAYKLPAKPEISIEELDKKAKQLVVNISGYFDESYDPANIEGMTLYEGKYNTFCLDALPVIAEAGDLIQIFKDTDGVYHLLVIARAFAPGIGELCFPGGFKEAKKIFDETSKETSEETCLREGAEETNVFELIKGFPVHQWMLPEIVSNTWDPRLRFVEEGIRNAGLLNYACATEAIHQ